MATIEDKYHTVASPKNHKKCGTGIRYWPVGGNISVNISDTFSSISTFLLVHASSMLYPPYSNSLEYMDFCFGMWKSEDVSRRCKYMHFIILLLLVLVSEEASLPIWWHKSFPIRIEMCDKYWGHIDDISSILRSLHS